MYVSFFVLKSFVRFPPPLADQSHPMELDHQARSPLIIIIEPPSSELLVKRPFHGFHLHLKLLKLLL